MARGIISCTGETFLIGDKVRTPDGKVIRVQGAAIGVTFYNAEKCTRVAPETRTTAEVAKDNNEAHIEKSLAQTDCIVWGG